MEDEGIVAVARWRAMEPRATPEAAVGVFVALFYEDFLLEPVLFPLIIRLLFGFQPPEVIREREIGQHEGELFDLPVVEKLRVGDGAGATFDVGLQTVQDRVDLADGEVAPVHLLPKIAGGKGIVSMLAQEICGVDEHAATATGWIVDRVARLRLQHTDEGVHDLRRSKKLARLSASVVGELFDEVFVGTPQDVRGYALVREVDLIEMLDEGVDHFVGDELLGATIGGGLIPDHREHAT